MSANPSLQLGAILILIATGSKNLLDDSPIFPQCGVVQRQTNTLQTRMIVGGDEAQSGAWPWQIAVLNRKKALTCGGTLINREFVLTAAHCVTNSMYITAGEYNLNEQEGHEQSRRVSRVIKHPAYNKDNVDNDIALLKLDSPVELTDRVWPACLPEQDEELSSSSNATILGWGAISYSRDSDGQTHVETGEMLRQVNVPVVDFDECKNSYGDDLKSQHVICAGYKEGGKDSCAGDSGGPLLFERNDKWYVYGVTSFGDECGKVEKYGIYSKTSAYIDWITKTVSKYSTRTTNSTPQGRLFQRH